MQWQSGKEGRFAPLFFLAILAAPAVAQDVTSADLAFCAAQGTDELKLACFEALAAKHTRADTVTASKPTDVPPITAEPPVRVATPSDANTAPPRGAPEPRIAAVVPPPVEKPAPSQAPEPGLLDDSIGQRHMDREAAVAEKEREVFAATITNVVTDPRTRKLTFEMANGQVWRQMQRGHFLYPKDKAFDVEIRRGLMGDYQMRVDGAGRMTRIVRVR